VSFKVFFTSLTQAYVLPGYDTSVGNWIFMFQGNIVYSSAKRTYWIPNLRPLCCLKTLTSDYPWMQHHVPEECNSQLPHALRNN